MPDISIGDSKLEPDPRWELYMITSLNDFAELFGVKSAFNPKIPFDILKAWETLEYLLNLAYYHWPLYDEGLNKALRILEMAVRLRAEELGIATKDNNNRPVSFGKLIQQICQGVHYEKLRQQFNRARQIRNWQMHPTHHSYMGGTGRMRSNIQLLVVLINQLFQPEAWHVQRHERLQQLKTLIESWSNLPLKTASGHPLLERIIGVIVHEQSLMVTASPVLQNPETLLSGPKAVKPIALQFYNYLITPQGICGNNECGEPITLSPTDHLDNICTYESFRQVMNQQPSTNQALYKSSIENDADWLQVEWEYEQYASAAKQTHLKPTDAVQRTE